MTSNFANLPSIFQFKQTEDLVRLGSNYDGGYLVSRKDVITSDVLIGLGINDDWSFEQDFLRINKVPTVMFDASVNFRFFIKITILSLLNIKKPLKMAHGLLTFLRYKKFFKNNVQHIKKFVGLNAAGPYTTMQSIFDKIESKAIFLKIDIEGSEYRVLETLVQNINKLTGCVIEFHDVDIHLNTIIEFLQKFKMNIIHIHVNNYGPVKLPCETPTVIEISFSKQTGTVQPRLPHTFDKPNNPLLPEYTLKFV